MTLSDRLQRAKTERLLAAGLVHSEAALKPEVVETAGEAEAEPELEIEVQAAGLHAVAPTDTGATSETSMTGTDLVDDERTAHCPNCRRLGRVDLVDLVGKNVHMTCDICGTMWRARHSVTHPSG